MPHHKSTNQQKVKQANNVDSVVAFWSGNQVENRMGFNFSQPTHSCILPHFIEPCLPIFAGTMNHELPTNNYPSVRILRMILLDQKFWEIKVTPKKGRGVFATKAIPAGRVIGDYLGKVIRTATEATSDKDGLYLMYYHNQAAIYPTDVNAKGIHLLNHSCAPNCWVYTYKGHTLFFSLRHIFAGEELTISYLLSPDDFCNPCPHQCRCEESHCSGTMHLSKGRFAKWNRFVSLQSKQTKKGRISYGKELPKLTSYPDTIADQPIYSLFGATQKPSLKLAAKKLPPNFKIRKLIRDTGRTLLFPNLKTNILGVVDDVIYSGPV
jgi:hypothetical protein